MHRTRVRSAPRPTPSARRAPSAPPITINFMTFVQRDCRTQETYETFSNSPIPDHLTCQYYLQQARQFLIQQPVASGMESRHALSSSRGHPNTLRPPVSRSGRPVLDLLRMTGRATAVNTSPVPPVRGRSQRRQVVFGDHREGLAHARSSADRQPSATSLSASWGPDTSHLRVKVLGKPPSTATICARPGSPRYGETWAEKYLS